ncbi:hypothetical protein M9H77_12637 [Catharanthus roseus]|uniref:Uncharacterized protein n=1 Tax=Catharanthus roseus TaxID=4058 RepID=A0ACC0BI43_CATRO|nr:hypothetical protein M9H77_12637 [Catharanthus roseus]
MTRKLKLITTRKLRGAAGPWEIYKYARARVGSGLDDAIAGILDWTVYLVRLDAAGPMQLDQGELKVMRLGQMLDRSGVVRLAGKLSKLNTSSLKTQGSRNLLMIIPRQGWKYLTRGSSTGKQNENTYLSRQTQTKNSMPKTSAVYCASGRPELIWEEHDMKKCERECLVSPRMLELIRGFEEQLGSLSESRHISTASTLEFKITRYAADPTAEHDVLSMKTDWAKPSTVLCPSSSGSTLPSLKLSTPSEEAIVQGTSHMQCSLDAFEHMIITKTVILVGMGFSYVFINRKGTCPAVGTESGYKYFRLGKIPIRQSSHAYASIKIMQMPDLYSCMPKHVNFQARAFSNI